MLYLRKYDNKRTHIFTYESEIFVMKRSKILTSMVASVLLFAVIFGCNDGARVKADKNKVIM